MEEPRRVEESFFLPHNTHSPVKAEREILLKRVFKGTFLNKCNIRQVKNGSVLTILSILGNMYILKLIAFLLLCVSYYGFLKFLLISLMKNLSNAEIES